jgi:uncharacterized protein (TIGR03435 family)
MASCRGIALVLSVAGVAMAQTETGPQFEVASIKPAAPGAHGAFFRNSPGGRVTISNLTLWALILNAYRIQPFQISGGPAWFNSDRYDIVAKAETTLNPGELQLMLQALLADRFHLTLHRETRELPVFALVMARKNGKLGPALIESQEGGCTPFDPTKPPAAPAKSPARPCGRMMMNPWAVRAISVPIADLISSLPTVLGRQVIDKTGLTGKYDITMDWTPDEAQLALRPPDAPRPPSDLSGPSIHQALQEQLGLKLNSQKGPVEILVIDHAEKPSEN